MQSCRRFVHINSFLLNMMKKDWNVELYRQFEAERTRPAEELLSRIPSSITVDYATDLGCGPGNSTELLFNAWPNANIVGIDSSQAMIEEAQKRLKSCSFVQSDITQWNFDSGTKQDIIFANASLHWLSGHETLLPHLISQLSDKGVLAIQMPNNFDQPSHALMRKVAATPKWSEKINADTAAIKRPLSPEGYYDILSSKGCSVDIWQTTYYHVMPSQASIVEWVRSTGLRRFVENLTKEEDEEFVKEYSKEISDSYKQRSDGKVLLPFPRLFIVAQKQ